MKCEKCGHENTIDDKFCTECGAELTTTSELQDLPVEPEEIKEEVKEETLAEEPQEEVIEEVPVEEPQEETPVVEETKPEEPKEKKPKKKMNFFQYITVILIVSLIVGGIVYFSMSFSLKKYQELSIKNAPYTEVKLSGFTYKIPQEYSYEKDADYVSVMDKDESWIIQIGSTKSSYDILKNNKALLQETFKNDGITATAPQVKNIKDKEYLTLELDENSKKSIVAYSKFNSMYINVVLIRNTNNEYDYDKLEIANKIINDATFNEEELNIEVDTYNVDDIISTTLKTS